MNSQCTVTQGRFDIQYATNTLTRYGTIPREGHLKRALGIFGYLKHNAKARLEFDPESLDMNGIKFEDHDRMDLFPNATEARDPHEPTGSNEDALQINVMFDASHASDLDSRRSVTGI